MASCSKCDGFSQRFNLASLREYRDIVRKLIEIVNQGTFFLVRASCSLQDMFNAPVPGDTIHHDFQCLMCGRAFHLGADLIMATQVGQSETDQNQLETVHRNPTETAPPTYDLW